jgi:hypothetical protein
MTGLELAYARARDIIGSKQAEGLDVAEEVERLRSARRPERVRVVLLAESHVWTSRDDTLCRVTLPGGDETGFARFVYCLGCGEPQLVERAVTANKTGTPQFWKLFHDTIYGPTIPHAGVLKTGERDCQKRVQNKLDLLRKMQSAGVWLVDASVTALYGNGIKLTPSHYRDVLKACWESHVREVLCGSAPSAVLIVGKGVDCAIGHLVRQDLEEDVEVVRIYAPNAREFGEVDRRKCFDLCCRYLA